MSDTYVVNREVPRATVEEYEAKMQARGLTADGAQEKPDPVPMEPPVGYQKQPSMFDRVRELVQREMAMRMENPQDYDPDEEEDFDVPDDDFPQSHHAYSAEDERAIREFVASRRKSASTQEVPPKAAQPQPVGTAPEEPST